MKRRIKVLQITPSFGVGGAEKLVLEYLLNNNKENMQMKAVSLYGSSNTVYDHIIKESGLDVVYLDKKPGIDISISKKLYRIISEFEPDVIHSHLHVMKYLIYSIIRYKDVKVFHTIHSEPSKDAKGIEKVFNKIAFKNYKVIPIALSQELGNKNNKYYRISTTKILRNGINLSLFKKDEKKRNEIRKILSLNDSTFVVGHVGRFDKYKNQEFVINVFDKLRSYTDDLHLLLIGDGELRNQIKEVVKERKLSRYVSFLGTRADIPDLYNAMDVFLFPSLYEGFPITLIEAQATGIKCVISDAIDKSCILSEDTIRLSLNYPLECWCEAMLNGDIKGKTTNSIVNYDMKNVIYDLERIYLGY